MEREIVPGALQARRNLGAPLPGLRLLRLLGENLVPGFTAGRTGARQAPEIKKKRPCRNGAVLVLREKLVKT